MPTKKQKERWARQQQAGPGQPATTTQNNPQSPRRQKKVEWYYETKNQVLMLVGFLVASCVFLSIIGSITPEEQPQRNPELTVQQPISEALKSKPQADPDSNSTPEPKSQTLTKLSPEEKEEIITAMERTVHQMSEESKAEFRSAFVGLIAEGYITPLGTSRNHYIIDRQTYNESDRETINTMMNIISTTTLLNYNTGNVMLQDQDRNILVTVHRDNFYKPDFRQ